MQIKILPKNNINMQHYIREDMCIAGKLNIITALVKILIPLGGIKIARPRLRGLSPWKRGRQYTNVNVMLLRRSFEDGATVLSLSTTLLCILLLLVVFLKHAHKSNLR